jgi:predicted ATP-dependent serine protease
MKVLLVSDRNEQKQALQKHFATCGERVRIHEGARFRNVHKISLGEYVTVGVDNFIQAAGGVTIGDYTTTLAVDLAIVSVMSAGLLALAIWAFNRRD